MESEICQQTMLPLFAGIRREDLPVIEFEAVVEYREVTLFIRVDRIPLDRGSHHHFVGGFRGGAFAEFLTALPSHLVIGSGKVSHASIAGAVGEQRSLETESPVSICWAITSSILLPFIFTAFT